jgi:hypothetical protein
MLKSLNNVYEECKSCLWICYLSKYKKLTLYSFHWNYQYMIYVLHHKDSLNLWISLSLVFSLWQYQNYSVLKNLEQLCNALAFMDHNVLLIQTKIAAWNKRLRLKFYVLNLKQDIILVLGAFVLTKKRSIKQPHILFVYLVIIVPL